MDQYVIAVLVSNIAGVLSRVSGMFTRRGFNIDSLTVSETEMHEYSRITISLTGDDGTCRQIIKQLKKLYNDRITSRLFGTFMPISFTGTDIRLELMKERR